MRCFASSGPSALILAVPLKLLNRKTGALVPERGVVEYQGLSRDYSNTWKY